MSTTEVLSHATRCTSLTADFDTVRRTTEQICSGLTAEDQMVQSMSDASPTKWHLAHTTWFFETFILKEHIPGYQPFHPDFTFLFNSYYKQVGQHPNRAFRGLFSRPNLEQVLDYRRHVEERMHTLLNASPDPAVATLTVLGLNHEQQHQELIVTDVKHALWSNPLKPRWRDADLSSSVTPEPLRWQDFAEGVYPVGSDGNGFIFDNESPRHNVFLNRFSVAARQVTNSEYFEFMQAGGYERPEFWLSDGWDRICAEHWNAPLYWEQRDGEWMTFTCSGWQPVNLQEPVCHVSYYEADAFARWAGARLATEAEWEVAASKQPIEGNFLDSGRFHPAPASSGFFGDVWQWTQSAYSPYPGFSPAPGALGEYNGKFMSSQMVLRGGSCATPQSHIRATYRNFFPPHARWQFMGIRLAK